MAYGPLEPANPNSMLRKLGLRENYMVVFHLVREYLEYKEQHGYTSKCFTYAGLYRYYIRIKRERERKHWHTIERTIRAMAQEGWFYRIHGKRVMIFCPDKPFQQALAEYNQKHGGKLL